MTLDELIFELNKWKECGLGDMPVHIHTEFRHPETNRPYQIKDSLVDVAASEETWNYGIFLLGSQFDALLGPEGYQYRMKGKEPTLLPLDT